MCDRDGDCDGDRDGDCDGDRDGNRGGDRGCIVDFLFCHKEDIQACRNTHIKLCIC